jgi:hypothetical protein
MWWQRHDDGTISAFIAYEGCQTPCIYIAWICDPLWVGVKPHCLAHYAVCNPAASSYQGFWLTISQIWATTCDDNEVVMDPYANPLHMKDVKHLVYVCHGCVIHYGWVMSLIACVMVQFETKQ